MTKKASISRLVSSQTTDLSKKERTAQIVVPAYTGILITLYMALIGNKYSAINKPN